MEFLPTELRQHILTHCSLPALKSLRLASRTWADLGFEYLASSTFTTLPHRPDFQRLLTVSQVPIFSQRIESLFINLGEINEYHARHNSYFIQYMRNPDERLAAQEMAWGAYAGFRGEKERYMPLACNPNMLNPAFKNLPNLKRIDVSLATCPFPQDDERTELLRQIWNIPSTRLLSPVATIERFTSLLTAISSSPARIEELSHDRLPFEFFSQKAMTITLVSTVFIPLTSLSLVLDCSDMSNMYSPQAFQNLFHCLRSASTLQTLQLSFQGRRKLDISPLLSSFSEHNFSYQELKEVKFEGILCPENALVQFLVRHKRLRKVQLGGIGSKAPHQKANGGVHLTEGTWRSVFKSVLESLGLERGCFLVQGDMLELDRGKSFVLEDLEAVADLGMFVSD